MTPPKKTKVEIRLGYFDEPRRACIALSVGRETILFGADDWPTIQAAVSNEIDKETDLVAIPVDRYNELMDDALRVAKLDKIKQDLWDRLEKRNSGVANLDLIEEVLNIIDPQKFKDHE